MSYILQASSSDQFSFEPEYDFVKSSAKIENMHRTRSGDRYVYKWGEYVRFKMSVKYVSSENASMVNDWWSENTALQFYEEGSTDITSCQITNKNTPFGEFVKPHNDLFEGRLELEEY